MMGYLAAELGRGDEALRSAAALVRLAPERREADLVRAQAGESRGNVLARAGLLSDALRHYESVYPMTWFGFRVSAMVSGGLARFQRADALARAGREDEALGWYGSVAEFSTFDLVYAALGHLQRARLLDRRKEAAAAAREYTRFLELWETADPEYQPLVREARERLSRLSDR
jgi:hypothetical protein